MKQKIKVAVIGGTGKSGKYLINQLLSQGFHFKILLRNPEKFRINSKSIEIIKGDARNIESIRSLLKGCDAVVSTLGQPKGESPKFSQATGNIISVMDEYQIRRYVIVTGLSIDSPFDKKSADTKMKSEMMKTYFPEIIADKQAEYNILEQSDVDWTLVRLPFIEQTDTKSEIKVSLEDCPGEKISATDLAIFLIEQLSDKSYIKKSPFVASL